MGNNNPLSELKVQWKRDLKVASLIWLVNPVSHLCFLNPVLLMLLGLESYPEPSPSTVGFRQLFGRLLKVTYHLSGLDIWLLSAVSPCLDHRGRSCEYFWVLGCGNSHSVCVSDKQLNQLPSESPLSLCLLSHCLCLNSYSYSCLDKIFSWTACYLALQCIIIFLRY